MMKFLQVNIGDRYSLPNEFQELVIKKFNALDQKAIRCSNLLDEWQTLNANLNNLGWQIKTANDQKVYINQDRESTKKAINWIKQLEKGRVINHGKIAEYSGFFLDFLDQNKKDMEVFITASLESLLKFFEVKRKKAIKAFQGNLSTNSAFLNGLQISILFSRAARRYCDLRYLNIALKMNEWFLPIINKNRNTILAVNYLLAVTEQELAALELLP